MKLVLAKSCDLIESVLPFGLEVKLNAYLSLMGNGKMLLSVIPEFKKNNNNNKSKCFLKISLFACK